jgi:hypothetical protein
VTYPKPIPSRCIFPRNTVSKEKGVEDRIIYIYTGEENSIVKDILGVEMLEETKKLRDKVKSLEMQKTTLTQELADARTGVGKSLSKIKDMEKSTRPPQTSIFSPRARLFGGPTNFEDFDDDV